MNDETRFSADHHLGVVIADVAGKGVSAALMMTMAHTLVRSHAPTLADPGACLQRVSQLLFEQSPRNMFVTMFYGILDLHNGQLSYANAGHNPPLLVRSGETRALPVKRSLAVAMMRDFPYATTREQLEPGDTLFLYTDGVVEAARLDRMMFEDEQLHQVLAEHTGQGSERLVMHVRDAVQAFTDGAPQSDDMTMLTLCYRGNDGVS